MNLITQADFARQLEISRQAVQDARRRGALGMSGKKIDLDHPVTKDYVAGAIKRRDEKRKERELTGDDLPQEVAEQKLRGTRKRRKKSEMGVVLPPKEDELPKKKRKSIPKVVASTDPDSKRALEMDLLRERKRNLQMKTRRERGELIDRELVKAYDSKTASIDSAELLTLGQRISANLAAAFMSDSPEAKIKAKQIVDKEIFTIMAHKKRMREDFLNDIKGLD